MEPMLATAVTNLPVGPHLVYEPKWDGFRALAETGPVRIVSRSGRRLDTLWPEIAAAVDAHLPDASAFDGEIVRWSAQGHLDFPALLHRNQAGPRRAQDLARSHPCHLVLFDALTIEGTDIGHRPLSYRRARLQELMAHVAQPSPLSLGWQTADVDEACQWFDALAAVGVEGLMAKDARSSYQPGRRGWLKYKRRLTTEAIVGAVIGDPARPRALILGRRDPETGELLMVGRTPELTARQQKDLSGLFQAAGAGHPWPSEPAPVSGWGRREREPHTLVEPRAVVEIAPDAAVADGKWRHLTRFVRARPDLSPAQIPTGLDVEG